MKNRDITWLLLLFILTACHIKRINHGIESNILRTYKAVTKENTRIGEITTYKKGENIIEIEIIRSLSNNSIEKLIKEKILDIELIYRDSVSSYPGEITSKISIEEKSKPVFKYEKKGNAKYIYAFLYTNNRFGLGVPIESSSTYQALIGWIHDIQKSTLYEVKIFFPLNDNFNNMKNMFLSMRSE